jgi:hypothetical protein
MLATYIQEIDEFIETHDEVSIHDIVNITHRDSHLFPIIILAVFASVSTPIPASGFLFGLPLIVLSALYLFKIDPAHYRGRLFRKKIPCRRWRPHLSASIPYAQKLQRLFRPRSEWVFRIESRVTSGISLIVFAVVMFLPIPLANLPSALGILAIAFGLMERDGLYVLLGYGLMLVYVLVIVAAKYWLLGMV